MNDTHEPVTLSSPVVGAVITISDRCSRGEAEDRSGPLAAANLETFGVTVNHPVVVPDDIDYIRSALQESLDAGARVVVTTGGTGVTPRDNTPEATEPFIAIRLDGLAQQIRLEGLASTPLATLSRGLVGVTSRGARGALIVNAPGSTGGVRDALAIVGPLIGHILSQLDGPTHQEERDDE